MESGTSSFPKRTLGPLRISDEGEGDAAAVCRGPPTRRVMPRGRGGPPEVLKFSFLKVSLVHIKVSF